MTIQDLTIQLEELGQPNFTLQHIEKKPTPVEKEGYKHFPLGQWCVHYINKKMELKYGIHPPAFYSDTPEECLGKLLNEIKSLK